MKKKLKSFLIIFLAAIMIFSLPLSVSAATKRDVTKTYSKSVTKLLRGFDSYFGYCCGKNQYFKFDDYARTTMVTMRTCGLCNRTISTAKKKLKPQKKLYFNTSTVKLLNMVFQKILLTYSAIRTVRLFILAVTGERYILKAPLKRL